MDELPPVEVAIADQEKAAVRDAMNEALVEAAALGSLWTALRMSGVSEVACDHAMLRYQAFRLGDLLDEFDIDDDDTEDE